eukprot:6480376-Amphidinium_carterae.1
MNTSSSRVFGQCGHDLDLARSKEDNNDTLTCLKASTTGREDLREDSITFCKQMVHGQKRELEQKESAWPGYACCFESSGLLIVDLVHNHDVQRELHMRSAIL